jgi:Rrf2 family cysteine metabolism transcriptional repressor|tara:strand:+ start:612 stop:1031 length:420 start_codon:yes stop_codon:yes gene_type:complete
LQVSKSLDYAVRSLTYIAKEKASVFTIRDISEKQHIPQNYLAKIMRKLVQKGLLSSSPGPEGGYSLRKPTEDISLKDIYEAIEGDMQLIDCMEKNVVCELFNSCTQRSVWDHLQLHTLTFLNDISVKDIADNKIVRKGK